MRADGVAERRLCPVFHAVLPANLLDDPGQARVMDVANLREKVVRGLEVQTPEVPGDLAVRAREFRRGLNLMSNPFRLYFFA